MPGSTRSRFAAEAFFVWELDLSTDTPHLYVVVEDEEEGWGVKLRT